jgi:hypothetical protein
MSESAGLERRYRRLLAAYPTEHRHVHGEEMIGVLLAAAGPGRDRGGLAQAIDLVRGGIRIRLRPRGALSDGEGWRAALAVFSVAFPVLMLAAVCLSSLTDLPLARFPFGLLGLTFAVLILGQALVLVFVLLGYRRVAAGVAIGQAAAGALRVLGTAVVFSPFRGGTLIAVGAGIALLSLAEAAALLGSPGPRAGLQLMSRRGWIAVLIASLPAAVLAPTFLLNRYGYFLVPLWSQQTVLWVRPAAYAGLAVALLALWLSSGLGKRLAVLFAAVAYPYLALSLAFSSFLLSWSPQTGLAVIGPALLVGFVLAVLIRRSSRPGPASPQVDQPAEQPGSGPGSGGTAAS